MAVLIDPPAWPAHGRLWSHLASDTSYDELHAFAERAAVPRRAFEGDHYDVPQERYDALVAAGAVPVPSRDLLKALQRSGLRRPKRKGERVIASQPAGDAWWDLITSRLPPPVPGPVVVLVQRSPARPREVLVVPRAGTWDLPAPDAAAAAGVDLTAARPCAHERTSPLRDGGPDLGRATWRTVRAAPAHGVRRDAPDGARWLRAEDAEADPPRWWPLVDWLAARR